MTVAHYIDFSRYPDRVVRLTLREISNDTLAAYIPRSSSAEIAAIRHKDREKVF